MSIKSKIKTAVWVLSHANVIGKALGKSYEKSVARQRKKALLDEETETIRASELFDEEWYLRNHIELQGKGVDLAHDYLVRGPRAGRNPSPYFFSEEYWEMNWDVRELGMNPLCHFEEYGRSEGRDMHAELQPDVKFPEGAVCCSRAFSESPVATRRLAVMSCFFAGGRIPETLLILLRGLKEVVDNIVLVGDCEVFPDELEKISDLVCFARFERHWQYDFGSYKRGLEYARANGLLGSESVDELVFINDSCYGPVFPFSESFDAMTEHYCDFWGYASFEPSYTKRHIQSFFMVFKRPVIDADLLDEFLEQVEGKLDRNEVVALLETRLTPFLLEHDMLPAAIIDGEDASKINLFNNPVTALKEFRIPLVKKKAFIRDSKEDLDEALDIIRANAPELASLVTVAENVRRDYPVISLEEHRLSFGKKVEAIKAKVVRGEKVRAVFLICSTSMFASRPLFDRMAGDELFDASIAVVPDFRKGRFPDNLIEACEDDLLALGYPQDAIVKATRDRIGRWRDVCEGADIVCYCMPYYQITSFRYSPYYAIGRDFLPVMVNYGFYRSLYDRKVLALDVYSYLWKAFFECDETVREYRACSRIGGENAETVGYVKMDSLAKYPKGANARKRILVALHHSIDGGSNDTLSLANFIRYLDYFRSLPDRFSDVDFTFRPHPFLFDALRVVEKWDNHAIESFVHEMSHKDNVTWSKGGDYFEEFAQSDACIQDCGSFLVEYFYTGNPCCYMLKEPADIDSKFAPLGKECLGHCYVAYDTVAIDSFIRDVVIGGDDAKAEDRRAFADRIMVNYPHASDAALQSIKNSILA